MGWEDDKAAFMARKNDLDQQSDVDTQVAALNTAVYTYLTSQDDTDKAQAQTQIQSISAALQTVKNNYSALHADILHAIQQDVTGSDVTQQVSANGTLQQHIQSLKQHHKDLQVEVDTARARDELLRSRVHQLSTHQLFLLGRPVRRTMIPYLWALSIFMIGVGVILFRMMFQFSFPDMDVMAVGGLWESVMSDSMIVYTLILCSAVTALCLMLKVTGLFGA